MLIKRAILPQLIKMSKSYPVVTILGPRQSGKSTLAKQAFPKKPYVSLEDLDERAFASKDPRGFVARFASGAILDEIQRQPSLLSYIQGIVDEKDIKGMFILTGSYQLELHQAVSQSLAGRTAVLKLLPLAITELASVDVDLSLEEYLLSGMYPRIYKDKIDPKNFYRDYTLTCVERDLRQLVNIKDLKTFQNFIRLCASRIGQVFNSSSLSNELGISHNTVKHWLSMLEASFLIFRLSPYYENLGKRIMKSPKLYFSDVGLASYLLDISSLEQIVRDPLKGKLMENFVILECLKHQLNQGIEPNFYYYRDSNGNEVDLLFKRGNKFVSVEIKSSMTFNAEFLKNLNYFKGLVRERCAAQFLIYSGSQEQQIGDCLVLNYKNLSKIFPTPTVLKSIN